MELKRVPFQRIPHGRAQAGVFTRQLLGLLAAMKPGDLLTYSDIKDRVGIDIQRSRYIWRRARILALQEKGQVFEVPTNEGIRCLESPEVLGREEEQIARLHRASQKIQDELDLGVDPTQLTPLEMHRWLAQKSIVGATKLFTHSKTMTQLEQGQAPPAIAWDVNVHKDLFRTP